MGMGMMGPLDRGAPCGVARREGATKAVHGLYFQLRQKSIDGETVAHEWNAEEVEGQDPDSPATLFYSQAVDDSQGSERRDQLRGARDAAERRSELLALFLPPRARGHEPGLRQRAGASARRSHGAGPPSRRSLRAHDGRHDDQHRRSLPAPEQRAGRARQQGHPASSAGGRYVPEHAGPQSDARDYPQAHQPQGADEREGAGRRAPVPARRASPHRHRARRGFGRTPDRRRDGRGARHARRPADQRWR